MAVFIALGGIHPFAAPLRAQTPVEVAGTLLVVWGDPVDLRAEVRHEFTLLTDSGELLPLALDPAAGGAIADPFALANRRVTVRIVRQEVALDGAGTSRPAPVLALRAERAGRDELRLATRAPEIRRYHTLLCKFPDWADVEPTTAEDLAARLSGPSGTPGYWLEVSDGRLDVSGPVTGWHMMPRTREEYGPGGSEPVLGTIAQDCATAADPEVDFSDIVGVNFVFNVSLGCCYYGGHAAVMVDGALKPIAATWLVADIASNQGIHAHEVGHSLGLPHASGPYGLIYDSFWDVMSWSAWYAVPGTDFQVGSHTNIFHKHQLGWVPPERALTIAPGSHSILMAPTADPSAGGYLYVRVPAPAFAPWEYYLLEVRGEHGYDAPLPGPGVVIHRVGGGGQSPSNAVDPDGNGEVSDAGSVLVPGERFMDRENGLLVVVEGREGGSFRVRVELDAYPRLVVARDTARYEATLAAPLVVEDSLAVTLEDAPAGSRWTARWSVGNHIRLLTTGGGDGDWLRWRVDTRGMPPGGHEGMLRLEHEGTLTDVFSRAEIAPETGLTAALGRAWTEDSTLVGAVRPGGVYLQLAGPGADSAAWTATTNAPWITLGSPAGTGPGTVSFTRDFGDLPPGVYSDSIRIDVPGALGSPLWLRETFRLIERPTLTVTRLAGAGTVRQGAFPEQDSIRLDLSGRAGEGALWLLSSDWDGHVRSDGVTTAGSGWARFRRAAGDRAPGTYVATIRLIPWVLPFDTVTVQDTLVVEAAPNALRAYPAHRSATVLGATEFSRDSVYVHPEGPDAATKQWIIEYPPGRIIPHTYASSASLPFQVSGPAWITYLRVLKDRAPGLHVDTIRLRFWGEGDEAMITVLDSLTVLGEPTVALGPRVGGARVVVGSAGPLADSAALMLAGYEADQVTWTASTGAAWIQLATTEGTGPGTLWWSRSPAALPVGVHVDTIRVFAAAAGSPALLVDSLEVVAPLAITTAGARPPGTMGAAYADSLVAAPAAGAVGWELAEGALPPGLALDVATGRITGIPEAAGAFAWSVRASADGQTATAALTLVVERPALARDAVIEALLGGTALHADHARFLDLLGNRNGRLDVGDVAAWLADPATDLTAAARAEARRQLGITNR